MYNYEWIKVPIKGSSYFTLKRIKTARKQKKPAPLLGGGRKRKLRACAPGAQPPMRKKCRNRLTHNDPNPPKGLPVTGIRNTHLLDCHWTSALQILHTAVGLENPASSNDTLNRVLGQLKNGVETSNDIEMLADRELKTNRNILGTLAESWERLQAFFPKTRAPWRWRPWSPTCT